MSEILQTHLGPAVLKRTARRTLAISVQPDGTLELVAPADISEECILLKVDKRRKWILAQRRQFVEMNAHRPQQRYVSGATHRYLGRQYRLKISSGESPGVLLKGGYFHVTTSTGDSEEVKKLLGKWFRQKAGEQFARRVAAWEPWCARHRLPTPRMRLLKMPKRWGSASSDGRIAFNPELIHMPSPCIDYVVTHEICHLKIPRHDSKFYRLLTSLLPEWKVLKQRLERG